MLDSINFTASVNITLSVLLQNRI